MGFENRKAVRVKAVFDLSFWADGISRGIGSWGQGINISETGLAFNCPENIPKGKIIIVEFASSARRRPIRVSSQVVYCAKEDTGKRQYQLRVQFVNLEAEERMLIRLHILQAADPKRAAFTGLGHAFFPGGSPFDCTYREMDPDERVKSIEAKLFFSVKELNYLRKFQDFLELNVGSRKPEGFRLLGSRALKNHSDVWVEFEFTNLRLHLIAETMWCSPDKDSKSEAGLIIVAYHKEEAFKLEKTS